MLALAAASRYHQSSVHVRDVGHDQVEVYADQATCSAAMTIAKEVATSCFRDKPFSHKVSSQNGYADREPEPRPHTIDVTAMGQTRDAPTPTTFYVDREASIFKLQRQRRSPLIIWCGTRLNFITSGKSQAPPRGLDGLVERI